MAEYIEREATMQAFLAEKPDAHYPGWYAGLLEELPAADVAPVVHGRWVEYPRAHYFKCSECRYTVPYRKAAIMVSGNRAYKYCPNCGARMDGEA